MITKREAFCTVAGAVLGTVALSTIAIFWSPPHATQSGQVPLPSQIPLRPDSGQILICAGGTCKDVTLDLLARCPGRDALSRNSRWQ
jgi:hypothetical protein